MVLVLAVRNSLRVFLLATGVEERVLAHDVVCVVETFVERLELYDDACVIWYVTLLVELDG